MSYAPPRSSKMTTKPGISFITFTSSLRARRLLGAGLAAYLALHLGACSDDAATESADPSASGAAGERAEDTSPAGNDAGGGGAGGQAAVAVGPIAVLTRVCSPETCQHYLNAFDELPDDAQIDRTLGAESGNTQGVVFGNAAYIFDRDDNSVTRWTIDDDSKLQAGATVSFQAAGVTDACAICNAFGDATHAYMVDSGGGVIVTWNPTTMEIVAVQDLPEDILTRNGLPAGFAWPKVVAGRAYMAASWMDYDTNEVYGSAAVATFDATVDEPEVSVIEDDRCGVSSSVTPFADEAGNVYVVGDWSSGLAQIGTATPAPNPACLLRINAGDAKFDPDYYVDLLEAAGARALYGGYGMAGGTQMLLNYWPVGDEPPTAAAIAADPYAYFAFNGFRYAVLDLATRTTVEVSAIPPAGAGNNTPLALDGVNLIQVYPEGNMSREVGADLFAISPEGDATKGLAAGPNADFEMIGRLR